MSEIWALLSSSCVSLGKRASGVKSEISLPLRVRTLRLVRVARGVMSEMWLLPRRSTVRFLKNLRSSIDFG